MKAPFERYLPAVRALKDRTTKHRVTGLAAEVAFFGVLSIFPGLLMITAALGTAEALVGSDLAVQAKKQIIGFLDLILTDEASGAIDAVEGLFEQTRPSLLTVASFFALAGLTRSFGVVVGALNLAYGSSEQRPWLHRRLLGLGLSIGTLLLVLITLILVVVGPLFGRGPEIAEMFGLDTSFLVAWSILRWPVVFLMLVAWAATLFHLSPCKPLPRWRNELPGAVFTTVLWLVVSLGLNLYLRLAADANPVFGVLGGGLILLVWLYLLSVALLLGGELNPIVASYAQARSVPVRERGPAEKAFQG